MSDLKNGTLRSILAGLYQFQSADMLSVFICRQLTERIGCELTAIGKHDGRRRMIKSIIALQPLSCGPLVPQANQTGITATNPFWDTIFDPERPVLSLSDMVSRRTWHRNPFYKELFVHDQVEDHLKMEVFGNRDEFITINVLRRKRGFSEQETGLLAQLRPHMMQAYRNAHQLESDGLVGNPAAHYWLVPVDAQGKVLLTMPAAVPEICGHTDQADQLPPAIRRWITFQAECLKRGHFDAAITPYELDTREGTWLFTLYTMYTPGHFMVSIRYRYATVPGPCLSRRESEIIQWVAAGKSNGEIAAILSLSLNTVKSHLKHSFIKLGVENRTAAVAVWKRLIARP